MHLTFLALKVKWERLLQSMSCVGKSIDNGQWRAFEGLLKKKCIV